MLNSRHSYRLDSRTFERRAGRPDKVRGQGGWNVADVRSHRAAPPRCR